MTQRRDCVGFAAAALGVALTWAVIRHSNLPLLWLEPVSGAWAFGAQPGPLAMGLYGRGLYALFAGAAAFAIGRSLGDLFIARLRLLAAATVLAAALALFVEASPPSPPTHAALVARLETP